MKNHFRWLFLTSNSFIGCRHIVNKCHLHHGAVCTTVLFAPCPSIGNCSCFQWWKRKEVEVVLDWCSKHLKICLPLCCRQSTYSVQWCVSILRRFHFNGFSLARYTFSYHSTSRKCNYLISLKNHWSISRFNKQEKTNFHLRWWRHILFYSVHIEGGGLIHDTIEVDNIFTENQFEVLPEVIFPFLHFFYQTLFPVSPNCWCNQV